MLVRNPWRPHAASAPAAAAPSDANTPAATPGSAGPTADKPLSDKDSVLLADVDNESGDAVFDQTLRLALSIQLEQSPFLTLISDQQIQRSLMLMKQPKSARLTPELAWELCQRNGAEVVIYPSIAKLSDQYILGIRAINCRTGDPVANQQSTAPDKDHVLQAVDSSATELRRRLGESLSQVQKYNTAIEQATTASLPALEAYSVGWMMNYRKGDSAGALAFFRRAIQIDPDFAMAYAALGQAYSNGYEPAHAAQYLRRAYALRERVSDREKFYIESRYQRLVTGDLIKARLANEQWAQLYPRDAVPLTSLALIDRYLGQYERALSEAQQALHLSLDSAQSYANLCFSYLLLNRLPEARSLASEALAKQLDSPIYRA
jgi:Flp pilus assembly protein TadD